MKSIWLKCDEGSYTMSTVIDFTGNSEKIRELIGCEYFELVRIHRLDDYNGLSGVCMLVDEEGWLKDKPIKNDIASLLYGCDVHNQPIAGNALIVRLEPYGEDIIGLTDAEVGIIQNWIMHHMARLLSKK